MSWELDAEHRDFQAVCRTFVDRHVRPAVGEAEALGRVPQQLWKELGAAGLLGLLTPEEYGGSGGDQLAVALLAEELARASGGLAISPLVSAYMAAPHIAMYGSAEQRAAYLPPLARGEIVAALAVTEPGAAAGRIVDAAVQIFGGSGYIEESAVARHYRDVRVLRIGGGADEIQLEILSRELTP